MGPPFPMGFQRFWARLLSHTNPPSRAATTERIEHAGMAAARVLPKGRETDHTVLYLHGGAYCIGSWHTQHGLITHLAVAADVTVVAPNYRLAPESPHPAALEDALRAYRSLLEAGIPANRIAVAGDSAGGGLALAMVHSLRDAGDPMPASLVLISPWTDLRGDTASMTKNIPIDPMLRPSWSRQCSALYLDGRDPNDPACSPLFGRQEGLPPVLIHVGTDELILDDSTRLEERCREAGVNVTLEIFDRMWHEFQIHAGVLRESDEAVSRIAEFLRAHFAERVDAPAVVHQTLALPS